MRDPCDLHVASITKLLASGAKAAASDVSDQALKAVEKAKVCVDFDNGSTAPLWPAQSVNVTFPGGSKPTDRGWFRTSCPTLGSATLANLSLS